jgi:2-C-methyl-D-erythritol 4-phosphate cytidylyltransferase
VMDYAGYPITLIDGSYDNIKITTPEDLEISEQKVRSTV